MTRYVVALGGTLLVLGVVLGLERPLGEPPLTLFFAAVMVAAWYGGLGPGLLATAISAAAISFYFEEPRYTIMIDSPITPIRLLIFGLTALVISGLNARRRAAMERAAGLVAIVESSEDAVIGVRLDGTVTAWNAGAERLYGYRADEMLGRPITRLARQDEPSELTTILARLAHGDRFGHFEAIRVGRTGHLVDVSVTASPVHDPNGRVVGASFVERDVTWRRAAAEATQRLAAVVTSSADAILAKTLDGTITAWNPAAERLYGYTAGEMIGRPIATIVPPERAEELRMILERVTAGETVQQLRTVRVRKDGRPVPIWLTVSPIRGATDKIVGAAAIARPAGGEVGGALGRLAALRGQIGAAPDLPAARAELLAAARDGTGADAATLYRWDPDGQQLVLVASLPPTSGDAPPVRPGQGAIGQAIERGEAVVFNDYARQIGAGTAAIQAGVVAAAAVPIVRSGCRLGALAVSSRAPDKVFDPNDAAALEALALAAAALLPNPS